MKFLTLVLSLVLAFSISPAQATTSIERLSPSDRDTVGRMVSFALLDRAAVQLNRFFASGDERELEPILKAWLPADQLRIKQELKSLPEKPKLRVEGATLLIGLKDAEVALEVVDPFEGIFLLDGKQIRIRPLSQYQQFSGKIDEVFEVSYQPHPIMSFFVPEAHAGLGTAFGKAAAIIAAKVSKPTAAAAGGYVKKEAASTAKSVGDSYFVRSTKEIREVNNPSLGTKVKEGVKSGAKSTAKWSAITIGGGAVVNTTFKCFGISSNEDLASLKCLEGVKQLPGRVLCDKELKTKDCVAKASDLAPPPEIVSDKEVPLAPLAEPVNGNKCTESRDGKSVFKEVFVRRIPPKVLYDPRKQDLPLKDFKPTMIQKVHFEFGKNPATGGLTDKAVVDSLAEPDPKDPTKVLKIVKQSFWIYKDEGTKWTMHIYDNPATELKSLNDPLAKYRPHRTVECDKSNLTKECAEEYARVIGAVSELKKCPVANPEQTKENIKSNRSNALQ